MSRVYLGLGSNLGDSRALLRLVPQQLAAAGVEIIAASSLYRSEPWGGVPQPPFLNAVLAVETEMPPHTLLDLCQGIELAAGRERKVHWGARTLDIDILLFGEEQIDDERLEVPHPYLTQREFVLAPLAELSPQLSVKGKTVATWLAELPPQGVQRIENSNIW